MKIYVCGYDQILDEKQASRLRIKPRQIVVKYCTDPVPLFNTRLEANMDCAMLRTASVSVGTHFCDFSVEELPSGQFAIICASHPALDKSN